MSDDWIDVIRATALAPDEHVTVELEDVGVLVFNVDGEFHALPDLCSHDNYPLSEGEVVGGTITCTLHGSKFCIRTGAPLSPPAYEPVHTFPVRVHDGIIQIRDDRWD